MQPAAAAQILRKDRAEIDPALHSLPGKCGKFAWGIRGVHNKPEGGCITAAAAAAHSLGWAASDKTPGSAAARPEYPLTLFMMSTARMWLKHLYQGWSWTSAKPHSIS